MEFSKWKQAEFDCNIQQIKCAEFDVLYYGLFFWDCLLIFRIEPQSIKSDLGVCYSDKQHKGNVGEGQFHINNRTLQHHLENYLTHNLSYDELLTLLSS